MVGEIVWWKSLVCSLVGLAILQNTSMGLEGITFLPSPWIIRNFNLFLSQFHFSDFMLEGKVAFPVVVIKDHLPFCNLWKVLLSKLFQILFIGLQNPWSYKILSSMNNKLHVVECNTCAYNAHFSLACPTNLPSSIYEQR